MKNGKYTARRTSGTKVFALLLSLVLVLGCAIGGTLAWLVAESATVTNTFTVGDINIDLKEHKLQDDGTLSTTELVTENSGYKMVPGYTLNKDPFATVNANSEDCYLFIKVEKSTGFDSYMSYTIDDGWTALTGTDGVYYRTVSASTADQTFNILKDKQVKVLDTVTKEMLTAEGFTNPTLKFTAYAVQQYKSNTETFTAAEAWEKVQPTSAT